MRQILCFGDSNTYGLIPGTKNRYDWETRWTGILDRKLKDKGYLVLLKKDYVEEPPYLKILFEMEEEEQRCCQQF